MGYALFVGLYRVASIQRVTQSKYWQVPAFAKLRNFGMGWPDERASIAFFDLGLEDFYAKGKLIIRWPPPELSWWRRAHKNELRVHAILEESALVPADFAGAVAIGTVWTSHFDRGSQQNARACRLVELCCQG